MIYHQKI